MAVLLLSAGYNLPVLEARAVVTVDAAVCSCHVEFVYFYGTSLRDRIEWRSVFNYQRLARELDYTSHHEQKTVAVYVLSFGALRSGAVVIYLYLPALIQLIPSRAFLPPRQTLQQKETVDDRRALLQKSFTQNTGRYIRPI
ncbi:hypothetical protein OUZ56_004519 [Daphnia magna]|uniref:Uncharacterized protein n=1 Tax=Daphnia magna TaxID=35525 RepID=A0ABQ9YQ49_9CRUS|nr:hypothetical protein OUZ56_004519 [Daphnia magna]